MEPVKDGAGQGDDYTTIQLFYNWTIIISETIIR